MSVEWHDVVARPRASYDGAVDRRRQVPKEAWKQAEREAFLRQVVDRGAQRLLDIGTGTGDDAVFFQEAGRSVTAIDLSPEMVRYARARGVDAREMNLERLDLPDGVFDAVWSLNVFLHLPGDRWDRALREARRTLAPEGLFYLGVYGGSTQEGIWEEDTYRPQRYFTFQTDDDLLDRLRSRRFRIIDFHTVDYGHALFHFQAELLGQPEAGVAR